MSTRQREQRAAESAEAREGRLQWMSALQHGRLAVETNEERRSITACHDLFRKCHTNFDTSTGSTKGHVCIRTVHALL